MIETEEGQSRMTIWSPEGQGSEQLRAIKEHAEAAHAYLLGPAMTAALVFREQRGPTALPPPPPPEPLSPKRFLVIPLVVADRSPFGALQLEGAERLQKTDLVFVNALANELAVAIDRHRAGRREIARRQSAEAESRERTLLYEQARHAVEERERVLGFVAHDLKNPLTTILLATHLLEQDARDPGRLKELPQDITLIRRSAERMRRLIEDLLDVVSIETGHLRIDLRPTAVEALLQETSTAFQRSAQEHGLRLRVEVEEGLPRALCDFDRLVQVVSNLLGNAIKVTASGGQVILRARRLGAEVELSVEDDGPGIREEDVAHVFDRYWRSSEQRYTGTGLGLAIARGIVNAHGGRIWVETQVGRGSTFSFTLPMADEG